MYKKTLILILSLIGVYTFGFSQNVGPDVNFNLVSLSENATTETFQVELFASAETPDNYQTSSFVLQIGLGNGQYSNLQIEQGANTYGDFSFYGVGTRPGAQIVAQNAFNLGNSQEVLVFPYVDPTGNQTKTPLDINNNENGNPELNLIRFTLDKTVPNPIAPVLLKRDDADAMILEPFFPISFTGAVAPNGGQLEDIYNENLSNAVLSLGDITFSNTLFNIYPIPSKGTVYIENPLIELVECTIYSLDGTAVHQETLSADAISALELSNLPKGVYLASISKGKSSKTTKIIIN